MAPRVSKTTPLRGEIGAEIWRPVRSPEVYIAEHRTDPEERKRKVANNSELREFRDDETGEGEEVT